ncbi:hypothetical protein HBI17_027020 [Parastagonospora nodorum]|nr:hypothetical protein HBH82_042920 [Parastagonospora nodorum]KAH4676257.1 hypothetical protein HBH78_155230 [Parastagonospora nodorum]KAH4784183.1 hypothetical protein HBH63_119100 [Parastagonospora nodorum]KAH4789474.1 hypothetical protein HBH62_050080 [Parastagonospora nodorum]KAH4932860.1 hypothetical protein HBI79_095280 [Parastagonospora nodorum]
MELTHLVGKLSVLTALLLLVGLIFGLFLLNVLEESDFSDLVAVVVDNVAVVVNLETSAVTKVTSSETTKDVTVLVADLTLLVDTHARHGVNAALLLLWLPALGLTDDVTVLVVDVAILVNLVAGKLLDIAFNDTTDDVAICSLDGTILDDLVVVEASEWSLRSRVGALGEFSTSDDVAFVVPDLALAIDLLADHGGWVSLSNTAKDLATGIDNVASLVDSAASKCAEVDFDLVLLLVRLGVALDITVLVDDVSVFVNGVANKLLLVAFGELTNTVALTILNESVLNNTESFESGKRSLLALDALVLGDQLASADDLASVVVDLTFAIRLAADKVFQFALSKAANGSTVAVDQVALLVQSKAIKDREILWLGLFLVLKGLGVTLDVAVLVKNVTIFIDGIADKTLSVTLDNLSDNVLILVSDLAIGNNAKALKASERSLRLSFTLVLRDELDTANNLSGVVPKLALVVELPASEFLSVALNETSNRNTLVTNNIALLVDSLALEAGEDITILVDSATDELLGVTLDDLADAVFVLVLNEAVLNDDKSIETSEWCFLLSLFLGNGLGAANDVALVVPELSLVIGSEARLGELLSITLDQFTDDVTVTVDELARLVDRETLKDRKRWAVLALFTLFGCVFGCVLRVFGSILGVFCGLASLIGGVFGFANLLLDDLGKGLDLANDIAVLVKYFTLLVDLLAGALLSVTLDKLANRLTLLVENFALLVDLETLESIDLGCDLNLFDLRLLGTLIGRYELGKCLDLSEDFAVLVDDFALLVDLLSSTFFGVTFDKLTDGLTLFVEDLALLVDLEALKSVDLGSDFNLLRLFLLGVLTLGIFTFRVFALGVFSLTKTLLELLDGLEGSLAGNDVDLSNDVSVLVKNLALFVDLLADALVKLAVFELTNLLALRVEHLALFVDLEAIKNAGVESARGRLLELVGSTLSKFYLAEHIAFAVDNFTLVIDSEALDVINVLKSAFLNVADNIAIIVEDVTFGVDLHALEGFDAGELILNVGSLLLDIVFGALSSLLNIALGLFCLLSDAILAFLIFFLIDEVGSFFSELSASDDVAFIIDNLALLVELAILDLRWVTFNETSNEVTILVKDLTSAVGGKTLENVDVGHFETVASFGLLLLLFYHFWQKFAAADKVTIVIEDLTVIANGVAGEVFGVTLNKVANVLAILVFDETLLVDLKALELV